MLDLTGRTLQWHPAADPPGAWAFAVEGNDVAETWWDADEGLVRVETATDVWKAEPMGLRPVCLSVGPAGGLVPHVVYAGELARGLVRFRTGREFELFAQLQQGRGPWAGIDDDRGEGVLRMVGRLGMGRMSWATSVSPEPRFSRVVWPLLVVWSALRTLRMKRPWLGLTAMGMSAGGVTRALEALEGAVSEA